MATTMALPDFRFVRLREHFGLESGVDHILDVELIPAGAQVGMQSFTANVFSLEEDYVFSTSTVRQTAGLSVQNYGYVYFTCWYMPFFETDAFTLPTDWGLFRTMLNKRVDKVETASPTTALVSIEPGLDADGNQLDPTNNPISQLGGSSEDENLLFRPDRIKQSALQTMQTTMPATLLYKRLVRLGMFYGNAWRTGKNENVQYMATFGGNVGTSFATALPGVVVWVMTIPPGPNDDATAGILKTRKVAPGGHEVTTDGNKVEYKEYSMTDDASGGVDYLDSWDDYKFLAPRRNPITGELEFTNDLEVVNNFRKLSLMRRSHYAVPWGTDATPFMKQVDLNVIMERDIIFRRNAGVNSFVSPAG